eukprot:CAMPEP_0183432368 /NCGR_PEP_ID=MMETSP0370-20130417/57135_1 /TAXON_ID=268820 /ORGANISM="Peridinium aciculiferum, Strain PAER-2" /LENGTH=128 /DNA_ID=CAMNT_0025618315 /DNA_START=98 /DNA_END=484 /DNA_ORIENTATION=-
MRAGRSLMTNAVLWLSLATLLATCEARSIRHLVGGVAAVQEVPAWVMAAPMIPEDAEASESPYPSQLEPATWEGPPLTAQGQAALQEMGGALPPLPTPLSQATLEAALNNMTSYDVVPRSATNASSAA